MREHQTETAGESSLHSVPVQDRHNDEVSFASHRDPLSQLANHAPFGESARVHASALNRATGSQPSRASNSVLQLQRQYGNRYVQRVLALARRGEGEAEVTPEVESTIERARGGGQGLDHGVRRQMESAFGSDFSGVRIHTGREAHALNRAVSALAFTTGQDIFFRDGAYNPSNSQGQELLAHELTHVVQQSSGQVRCKFVLGEPGDQSEQEADRVAHAVVRGLEAGPKAVPARAESVQRKCDCGEETATGEECSDCRAKRLAMSRNALSYSTSNSKPGWQSATTTLDAGIDDDSPLATLTGSDFGVSVASASKPIQLQDNGGGAGGQPDGAGGGTETVTACTPTAKFTSIPSGKLSATSGSGRFGASFNMNAQFTAPVPCTCVSGEYRQFVRGFFKVNGVAQTHALCSNTMDTSTWNEDCATIGGTNFKYGYHSIPFATSRFTDPDQTTGCTFNGFDFPGFNLTAFNSGDKLEMHLEFQGKLVDASSGDAQLAASSWTVEGSTTIP